MEHIRESRMKADLHNHLRTSDRLYDEDFNRAVDKAQERLGYSSAIAMVNFADQRYEEFIALKGYSRDYIGESKNAVYVPRKGVLFIKGQEIPTKQGHVLVLGLPAGKHLKNGRPIEDTLKEARDNNGITVIDHPFYIGSAGYYLEKRLELLDQVDALETHNGEAACYARPIPGYANRRAKEFYWVMSEVFLHLGALSSSDGHSFYELGSSWVEITKPDLENRSNFIPSLKDAIRKTKMNAPRRNGNSYIGGVDHMVDLATIILASKIPILKEFIPKSKQQDLAAI